jgi:hypothetical protein
VKVFFAPSRLLSWRLTLWVFMELHTGELDGSWVLDIFHSSPNTRQSKLEAESQTPQANDVDGPTYI